MAGDRRVVLARRSRFSAPTGNICSLSRTATIAREAAATRRRAPPPAPAGSISSLSPRTPLRPLPPRATKCNRPRREASERVVRPGDAEGADKAKTARRPSRDGRARKSSVKVDLDGLPERIGALPWPPADYSHLSRVGDGSTTVARGRADGKARCRSTISKTQGDQAGQPDRLPHLGQRQEDFGPLRRIVRHRRPAGRQGETETDGTALDLSNMKVQLDRRAEWNADLPRMLAADA